MRPGKRDVPVRLVIAGAELDELHGVIGALSESFGLDRRIERYRGKRPIALYQWDLDLLVDVVGDAMRDAEERETRRPQAWAGARRPEAAPLRSLLARLRLARVEARRSAAGRGPGDATERGR